MRPLLGVNDSALVHYGAACGHPENATLFWRRCRAIGPTSAVLFAELVWPRPFRFLHYGSGLVHFPLELDQRQ